MGIDQMSYYMNTSFVVKKPTDTIEDLYFRVPNTAFEHLLCKDFEGSSYGRNYYKKIYTAPMTIWEQLGYFFGLNKMNLYFVYQMVNMFNSEYSRPIQN